MRLETFANLAHQRENGFRATEKTTFGEDHFAWATFVQERWLQAVSGLSCVATQKSGFYKIV